MEHAIRERLDAGLEHIRRSPSDEGVVELVVRRPAENEREILSEGVLDVDEGLVGDTWRLRGGRGGEPNRDMQLTLMNARCIALVAGERERWGLAGDQLYVDLDLSIGNLTPGTQLAVGTALVEVTAEPHTGCAKFSSRFGSDALRFVNAPSGRELRLRGMNTKVVGSGVVRPGDAIRRV